MRMSIVILVLFLIPQYLTGQSERDFRYHDSLTYKLYLEERWKELSYAGRNALNDGHDYYFMRMRLGISLYERALYAAAARHFRMALTFSEGDPVATEYLYYCSLLSGEYGRASAIISSMSDDHGKKVIEESGLARNSIWLSVYYNNYDTDNYVSSPSLYIANDYVGTVSFARQLVNPSITMSHNISPGVYYIHAFNNITRTSLLHYNDGIRIINLDDQKVFQNQYYGSLSVTGKGGYSFRPYLHLALSDYEYILAGGSISPGCYAVGRNSVLHYSAGMNLRQRTGYSAIDVTGAVNSFGAGSALQGEAGIVLYPFGNGSFYAGGRIAGIVQPGETFSSFSRAYTLLAGFSVPGKFQADFTFIDGGNRNMSSGNGLYLFNGPDFIEQRLLFNITIPFGTTSGLSFFAGGGLNKHKTSWFAFDNTLTGDQLYKYSSFNINGGFLWNF